MVSCHNDLKPDNILFDGERAWLVDWEAAFLNNRYTELSVVANFLITNDNEEKDYLEIKNTINSVFERILFEESDLDPILDLLIHDKKNEYGTIQFALLDGIGKIKINQTAEKELIIAAFEEYKK